MLYLYLFLSLAVAGLAYMRFEATWLDVRRVRLTKGKGGLKILQLSDIHIRRLKVPYKKIKQAIDAEKPDMVIMSGDYVEKSWHVPQFFHFLDYIRGEHTIYLCLGNHDYEAFEKDPAGMGNYIREIEKRGIILLHNQCAHIEKNAKYYNIIGIADVRYKKQDIEKALQSCRQDAFMNIAFSHNPDVVLEIPRGKVDYLLCGHFHGGQIWAPFNLEFSLMRTEKLCKMGITHGMHKVNGIHLYINRGLGNVVVPLRFLSRPEITVLELP